MRLSQVAKGFFENQFSKPGPARTAHKQRGLAYTWAVFTCPTLLVLIGNHPDVQERFIRQYRPIEYPPQSNPSIIYDIYHNKKPSRSSLESYEKTGRVVGKGDQALAK